VHKTVTFDRMAILWKTTAINFSIAVEETTTEPFTFITSYTSIYLITLLQRTETFRECEKEHTRAMARPANRVMTTTSSLSMSSSFRIRLSRNKFAHRLYTPDLRSSCPSFRQQTHTRIRIESNDLTQVYRSGKSHVPAVECFIEHRDCRKSST
jgi:hypothetical protein